MARANHDRVRGCADEDGAELRVRNSLRDAVGHRMRCTAAKRVGIPG